MPNSPDRLSRFWQELKRRKVIYVVTVYATAAFVIIELFNNVVEPLSLPERTTTIVIVILAIGFPIAIIFSWIFDVTSGGIEKTKPLIGISNDYKSVTPNSWKIATYVSIVVIIGLLALNIFGYQDSVKIDESLEKSIAILPFLNLSGDPNQDFICEGLTDEIIKHLYRIESFGRIPSLLSVLNYTNTDKSPKEIAEELQVNYILQCTYKKLEGLMRFSVLLIEPRSEKRIWNDDFDKSTDKIIAIPSDIALQIANHLKAFITDPEKRSIQRIATSNEEAFYKYHLGRFYQRKGGRLRNDNLASIEQFNEAISLDPNFAFAYTYLARAKLDRYWFHYERTSLLLNEIKELIDKAIEIDPEQPDAYIVMAQYYYHGFLDYANALLQLEKASQFAPDHPEYIYLKAAVIRRMGDWYQAAELFQVAHIGDPGNIEYFWDMCETYAFIGKFQEAITYLDKAILIDPYNPLGYEIKTFTYLIEGDVKKAKEVLRESESRDVLQDVLDEAIYFTPISIDIYDEEYQKALDYLSQTDWEGHFNLNLYRPKSLFQAQLYGWMNLPDIAKAYFDSTRIILEKDLQEQNDDHRILASLGIAFAGLGDKYKAIELGKKALNLYSVEMDAFKSLIRIADLAYIYVMVGEYDAALEQLEVLLSKPGPFSAALLNLDPIWNPLWDHPDFIRLTEKYSKKGSENYDS